MTVDLIRAWIEDKIPAAREDVEEGKRVAPNSYGTGFDSGYLQALLEVLAFANGEL